MTRVVFFGQSLTVFDWLLIRPDIEIVRVYASKLTPATRPQWLTRSVISAVPVIEVGEGGLSVDQIEETLDPALDLGICAHFEILPTGVIYRFRLGIVNIHPAPLPQFPGRYPLIELCLSDTPRGGVSIHWMSERVDRGDLIAVQELPRHPLDGPSELERRAEQFACQLLGEHWGGIIGGYAPRIAQLDSSGVAFKRHKRMSRAIPSPCDFDSVRDLLKAVIAYSPYGGLGLSLQLREREVRVRLTRAELAAVIDPESCRESFIEERAFSVVSMIDLGALIPSAEVSVLIETSWPLEIEKEGEATPCRLKCVISLDHPVGSIEHHDFTQTISHDLSEPITLERCHQTLFLP